MTTEELNTIVEAVVAELEKNGVDFDNEVKEPQNSDLVFVIRETDSGYGGFKVTWKGLLDIITAQATQAKTDAVNAKDIAQQILTQVQNKGTEITNFVATSKAEIETQKDESVNAVKSVYQTDLNELKGDLSDLFDYGYVREDLQCETGRIADDGTITSHNTYIRSIDYFGLNGPVIIEKPTSSYLWLFRYDDYGTLKSFEYLGINETRKSIICSNSEKYKITFKKYPDESSVGNVSEWANTINIYQEEKKLAKDSRCNDIETVILQNRKAISQNEKSILHIEDDLYEYEALSPFATSDGWRLNNTNDGYCSVDNDYCMKKFNINEGCLYRIKTNDRFQFQSSENVPSVGDLTRIGETYEYFGYIEAPIKSYKLIVSTLKTDDISVELVHPKDKSWEKEQLTYNDSYMDGHKFHRCYNPYKFGGNNTYTGQLHCHTWGASLYGTPDEIVSAHKNNGYDFMTITDYSYASDFHTDGKASHPNNIPDDFVWLFDSMEVSIPAEGNYSIKHMCHYNLENAVLYNSYATIQEVSDNAKEIGGFTSLAHPMWSGTYYMPIQIQRTIKSGLRFCEVYNGATDKAGSGQYPSGKIEDFAWETLLDNGVITWGIGVSDAHTRDNIDEIKDGCVKVFANSLNRNEIIKNLCMGNFYVSTRVDVEIAGISFENGVITVNVGENATVVFKKETGVVVKEESGTSVSYTMDGTEKYVRAMVTFENGERVWIQPIINIKSKAIDNFWD